MEAEEQHNEQEAQLTCASYSPCIMGQSHFLQMLEQKSTCDVFRRHHFLERSGKLF